MSDIKLESISLAIKTKSRANAAFKKNAIRVPTIELTWSNSLCWLNPAHEQSAHVHYKKMSQIIVSKLFIFISKS